MYQGVDNIPLPFPQIDKANKAQVGNNLADPWIFAVDLLAVSPYFGGYLH